MNRREVRGAKGRKYGAGMDGSALEEGTADVVGKGTAYSVIATRSEEYEGSVRYPENDTKRTKLLDGLSDGVECDG